MHALVIQFWYNIAVCHIYWCMAVAINTHNQRNTKPLVFG